MHRFNDPAYLIELKEEWKVYEEDAISKNYIHVAIAIRDKIVILEDLIVRLEHRTKKLMEEDEHRYKSALYYNKKRVTL